VCYCELLELSKGLLTPLIGVVTVYIAYQQWRTNQQKLKLDCYDRRLKVYEELKSIIVASLNRKTTNDDIIKYNRAVAESDFLFDTDITEYLKEVSKHCINIRQYNEEYHEVTINHSDKYNPQEAADGIYAESTWLLEQHKNLKTKFERYLKIKTRFWFC
jgi:hypothetical protein